MALSTIAVTIANNSYKGYMEVQSRLNSQSYSGINYVLIYRKKHTGNQEYKKIFEKKIESIGDFVFDYYDITTESNKSYDYLIQLTDSIDPGYTIVEFETKSNISCWFDGLFVGDFDTQYIAHLNCSTSTVRNTQANYVTTLSGRTPYKVSNSDLNYTTGQSAGLFCILDENNNLVPDNDGEYTNEIVDYLSDGKSKIIKTSSGNAWYVSIDQNIDVSSNDNYSGYNMISFSWTEIDDMPLMKRVT